MSDFDSYSRLEMLRALNPEFAKAEVRGETWAIRQAECVRGLDGKASRRFPERAFNENNGPRNHCGSCPYEDGCMTCDLPENHSFRKKFGPAWPAEPKRRTYKNRKD